jgi:hypothetical protein
MREALILAGETWRKRDGQFLRVFDGLNYDLMLEVKNKEKSARIALQIARDYFGKQ